MTTVGILLTAADNLTIDPIRSVFRKTFPSTYISKNDKLALLGCSIAYSWFNLTAAFNNCLGCSYNYNGINYPVVFPPGFYSVSDISGFLAFTMKANGHYLLDQNLNEVYFLTLTVNEVYYAVTLTATPVPAVLPVGWTNVGGMVLTGLSPQLVISGATNWKTLIGYAGGTFPAAPSAIVYTVNSTAIPIISPITQVLIAAPNMVNNGTFSIFPSIIGSFLPNGTFGAPLSINPPVLTWYPVLPGNYNYIDLQFLDQNYNPLQIKDSSQTVISLLLQQPS
jgi:hypothetical protein